MAKLKAQKCDQKIRKKPDSPRSMQTNKQTSATEQNNLESCKRDQ